VKNDEMMGWIKQKREMAIWKEQKQCNVMIKLEWNKLAKVSF
jgi:hypothetical protein